MTALPSSNINSHPAYGPNNNSRFRVRQRLVLKTKQLLEVASFPRWTHQPCCCELKLQKVLPAFCCAHFSPIWHAAVSSRGLGNPALTASALQLVGNASAVCLVRIRGYIFVDHF